VPLVAAAVCPHPPLLVPEIAGAAAAELDELRSTCEEAVAGLVHAGARTLVIVGADARGGELPGPWQGSFQPWGAAVPVSLGQPDDAEVGTDRLSLGLLVGAWLAARVGQRQPAGTALTYRMIGVAPEATVADCADVGAGLVTGADDRPWALLVMGDGSACRGTKAPGYDDPRAEPYDTGVARALAGADADALLGLDPELSAQLRVAGRAPWQVLAGAVRATGGAWHGELLRHVAPYGVGYLVARWTPA
jgi:hypothetical protein